MNEKDLNLVAGKLPLSASTLKRNQDQLHANAAGVRADHAQPVEGNALVSSAPRKEKGNDGAPVSLEPARRLRIRFTIYAIRPCDWDGYDIKQIQDLLVRAGILGGDEWYSLRGEVLSEKVYAKDEERTVIEIEDL